MFNIRCDCTKISVQYDTIGQCWGNFLGSDQIGIRNSSKDAVSVITTWQELLQHYGPSTDVQIEIIRKFEEICLEFAQDYAPAFDRILQELCEKKVPTKEAILLWEFEK